MNYIHIFLSDPSTLSTLPESIQCVLALMIAPVASVVATSIALAIHTTQVVGDMLRKK